MIQYPKNELAQIIINHCVKNGIVNAVISPGSRNAPLTVGFVNHPEIDCYSIVDERSAGFFALGLAQQSLKPVVLVCTSGSALLNYFPAVAEAFYSNIPLVIISADRPSHLIDIGDGQTIRQEYVYGNHILYNANLVEPRSHKIDKPDNSAKTESQSDSEEDNELLIVNALHEAIKKEGPVHINVPFSEPLYETTTSLEFDKFISSKVLPNEIKIDTIREELAIEGQMISSVADIWNSSLKKMILIGTNPPDQVLQRQLDEMANDASLIVLTETTSNLYNGRFINSIDKAIYPMNNEELELLKPDILITIGGMIVSKKVKQFLRASSPKHHWHIDSINARDTFFCLEYHFTVTPSLFFEQLKDVALEKQSDYQKNWLRIKEKRTIKHVEFLKNAPFTDLKAMEVILKQFPHQLHLQLSNSSIIRYSQLFDLAGQQEVYCNRGTSGIEGSTSTAIGASIMNSKQTVLITGDIGFLYDSNALWNNYIQNNFRIILINNSGGGIFRFIPGPKSTNSLEYFETPHQLNAEHLCRMYGFEYLIAKDELQLAEELKSFYILGEEPKLLEVFTPSEVNDQILESYFKALNS